MKIVSVSGVTTVNPIISYEKDKTCTLRTFWKCNLCIPSFFLIDPNDWVSLLWWQMCFYFLQRFLISDTCAAMNSNNSTVW